MRIEYSTRRTEMRHAMAPATSFAPSRFDKNRKRPGRKSPARDARFAQRALEIVRGAQRPAAEGTSVCDLHTLNTPIEAPSYPHPFTSTHTPNTSHRTPKTYANDNHRRPTATPIAHRVPAQWRDLSDEGRAPWFLEALKSLGTTHALTFDLSPDVAAELEQSPSAIADMHDRARRELKAQLGRTVPFFLAIEQTPEGRLHFHGGAVFDQCEAAAVRKALRRAGGEWQTTRQHQAHTSVDPDQGWSGYVTKDFRFAGPLARRILAGCPKRRRRFNGKLMSATQDVRRAAKRLYEVWRDQFVNASNNESQKGRNKDKSLVTYARFHVDNYWLTSTANRLTHSASSIGDLPQCIRVTPIFQKKPTPGLSAPLWWPQPSSVPARAASRPTRSRSRSARLEACGPRAFSPTSCAGMSITCAALIRWLLRDSGKPVGGLWGLRATYPSGRLETGAGESLGGVDESLKQRRPAGAIAPRVTQPRRTMSMRHEEFVTLVNDVRTGRHKGKEHEGTIETTWNGEPVTLVPDGSTGPYMIKNGETIAIDERAAFRAPGESWED